METLYRQRTFKPDEVEAMTQAMHEDGFALIPNVMTPEQVETACRKIDDLTAFGFDREGKTDHYKCVFNRDPYWLQYLDWDGVVDLAEATMGAQCHIIGQTAWRSHPGHDGWGPHTDRTFFELPSEVAKMIEVPIYLCTAHYYLTDITLDLCPTYVIPGSHRSGRALTGADGPHPKFEGRELEPVLCKAGDVLFFRSDVWHSGSLNKTADQTRYLLQVHYSHRYIAQQFSPFLEWKFNPEVLAACNPQQLRLLGNHPQGAYD